MNVAQLPSPNYDNITIPVNYLVLHYTAADLKDTLAIFMAEDSVSAHLVIDVDGSVTELVECLSGSAKQAWHAGVSYWQGVESLNKCALGIELVNLNGNLFPYTEAQYESLAVVVKKLQHHYPALRNPERVLGHEHIAGFRGKADPGRCFDWSRFFGASFEKAAYPERHSMCTVQQQQRLRMWANNRPEDALHQPAFWQNFSERTERMVKQAQSHNCAQPGDNATKD